jgi:hypothetical protein
MLNKLKELYTEISLSKEQTGLEIVKQLIIEAAEIEPSRIEEEDLFLTGTLIGGDEAYENLEKTKAISITNHGVGFKIRIYKKSGDKWVNILRGN